MNTHPRPPTRRPPLGEATRRVNNSQHDQQTHEAKASIPHHESAGIGQRRGGHTAQPNSSVEPDNSSHHLRRLSHRGSEASNAVNPRLSAIAKEYPASNRNSQISTTSTNSEGKKLKSYIGPWKLGKTLGKGATARVRLARHSVTGQEAAVKIVQKKNAQLSQAGSLADLDKAVSKLAEDEEGLRRMPVGIEREVAIMKLIQHPNIMKLYDIWENRTEIYLVLEYVENGELFDHISNTGRLSEEEALRCFRQILSAVGYCHSFNICHRDLKPENILLSKTGQIKIADFGMAALQQGPDHKLVTSCGSPHYAAPELIKGSAYRGNMVDIWSMGVVLYATLAGKLPFDVDGASNDFLAPLLTKIKKGQYEMPSEFSNEAKSLIRKMLQVNPKDRITLPQIWKHPLLKKYDYLDDLSASGYPQSPSLKQCGRPVVRRSEISKEILCHLRSMWHTLSEQQLIDALLNEEPNEQKLFYSLLVRYRDVQLENYAPDIAYSTSDYHHVQRATLTKTYSTCHFPPKSKGHGRQASKFTVISNIAETERSYDPFKASRPQYLNETRNDRAIVTIYRPKDDAYNVDTPVPAKQAPRASSLVITSNRRRQQSLAPPKVYASRSSMASSTRSRGSNPYVRATIGHKRGVSFSHLRRNSLGSERQLSEYIPTPTRNNRHSNRTEVTDDGGSLMRPLNGAPVSTLYIRSRKGQHMATQALPSPIKSGRASIIWGEDVRQLSSSLAKDCDEAFNRTSVTLEAEVSDISVLSKNSNSSKRSSGVEQSLKLKSTARLTPPRLTKLNHTALNSRPLPLAPARTESVEIELLEAKKRAELRKRSGDSESPRYLDRMVSHIDELMQPLSPTRDHRLSSAPVDTRRVSATRALPSIYEDPSPQRSKETAVSSKHQYRTDIKNGRIASAPEPRETQKPHRDDRFMRPNSLVRETIRVVNSTSFDSPVKAPAPLTIRKKNSSGPPPLFMGGLGGQQNKPNWRRPSAFGLREQYQASAEAREEVRRIEEDRKDEDRITNEGSSGTIVKKRSGWFKRNSKSEEEDWQMSTAGETISSKADADDVQPPYERPANPLLMSPPPDPPKKKGFNLGRLFKKRSQKADMAMSAHDNFDDDASTPDSLVDYQRHSHASRSVDSGDGRVRQIAPQRNWLAKLFHVKPPAKFICFSVSKRKARREIVALLKDWRRYGIKDIQVDKERNIVFGRVAAQNYLQMKEVAFASEIMTVIEHGKRSHLSITRFTQEHGAASSFQKVVETLEAVFKCRGLLVSDERKKRMMIKTLNAA